MKEGTLSILVSLASQHFVMLQELSLMASFPIAELVGRKVNLKFRWKRSQVSARQRQESMEGAGRIQQCTEKEDFWRSTL